MSPRLVLIPRESASEQRMPARDAERSEAQPHGGDGGGEGDLQDRRELDQMWWWAGL